MAELLSPWECFLLKMDMGDWLELNPCPCEARCECDDEPNAVV